MTIRRLPLPLGPSTLLTLCLLMAAAGCHAVNFYTPTLQAPVPARMEAPRELSKVSLPTYRIEPPDVLWIGSVKLVPRPPYQIGIFDVLQIRALGTLGEEPINSYYLVEADGSVNFGPIYGSVRVEGMSVEEANREITLHLQTILRCR